MEKSSMIMFKMLKGQSIGGVKSGTEEKAIKIEAILMLCSEQPALLRLTAGDWKGPAWPPVTVATPVPACPSRGPRHSNRREVRSTHNL